MASLLTLNISTPYCSVSIVNFEHLIDGQVTASMWLFFWLAKIMFFVKTC